MLSKLINLISDHWEVIATRVIRQMRRNADLLEMGKLSEQDLTERTREILTQLPTWLISSEAEVASHYELLGKRRSAEGIPLYEVVRALQLIKESAIAYIREQGMAWSTVDLYTSEEFEHDIGRMFDKMIFSVVRGYERSIRSAAEGVNPAASQV
ncbi:MAG: hypothetical protein HUU41_11280 [Bryobacteraceae bacterium]|nr:hypothetical protein [Bryobacterales bacterium]MEB2362997.1 hypothetical protein [Bryobacterales bacterium]NUN01687.1 hypothetical protein [Bryobacteraceae bacterium]